MCNMETNNNSKSTIISDASEKLMQNLATLTIIVGIIAAVGVLLSNNDFVTGLFYAAGVIIGSLISGTFLNVLANISLRLKDIQETLSVDENDENESE